VFKGRHGGHVLPLIRKRQPCWRPRLFLRELSPFICKPSLLFPLKSMATDHLSESQHRSVSNKFENSVSVFVTVQCANGNWLSISGRSVRVVFAYLISIQLFSCNFHIHFTLVKRKYQDTNRSQEPILNVRYFLLKPPNNNRMSFLYFYGNQTPKLLDTLMV